MENTHGYGRATVVNPRFFSLNLTAALLAISLLASPGAATPTPYAAFPGEPASDLYSSVTVGGVPVEVRKFAPVGLRTPPLHYARFAQPTSEANAVVVTLTPAR